MYRNVPKNIFRNVWKCTEKATSKVIWVGKGTLDVILKGLDHRYAHARRHALQNKFVGSTMNSKTPVLLQSFKIRRFVFTSVALAGPVILQY